MRVSVLDHSEEMCLDLRSHWYRSVMRIATTMNMVEPSQAIVISTCRPRVSNGGLLLHAWTTYIIPPQATGFLGDPQPQARGHHDGANGIEDGGVDGHPCHSGRVDIVGVRPVGDVVDGQAYDVAVGGHDGELLLGGNAADFGAEQTVSCWR